MNAVQMNNTRTGSTLLYRLLNSHPSIFACDELFAKESPHNKRICMLRPYEFYKKKMSIYEYLKMFFSYNSHTCFKVIPHIHFKNYPDLAGVIKGLPVIHLKRDYIARAVSAFAHNGKLETVTYKDFIDEIETAVLIDNSIELFAKSFPSIQVNYEWMIKPERVTYYGKELTFASNRLNKVVSDFFKVPYFEMYADSVKELKDDYWSYIKKPIVERLKEVANDLATRTTISR